METFLTRHPPSGFHMSAWAWHGSLRDDPDVDSACLMLPTERNAFALSRPWRPRNIRRGGNEYSRPAQGNVAEGHCGLCRHP